MARDTGRIDNIEYKQNNNTTFMKWKQNKNFSFIILLELNWA